MPNTQETIAQPERRAAVASLVQEYYEDRATGEFEAARKRQRDRQRFSPRLHALAIALCGVAWVFLSMNPQGEPPLTQEEVEKSARISIYLASLRVREFRSTAGRVPATLAEAQAEEPGVQYLRSSDSTFILSADAGQRRISYSSTSDMGEFLGPDASGLRPRQ